MRTDPPPILHLLHETRSGPDVPSWLAMIRHAIDATPKFDHRLLLLATPRYDAVVDELGLKSITHRLTLPFNSMILGWNRAVAALTGRKQPHLVHQWCIDSPMIDEPPRLKRGTYGVKTGWVTGPMPGVNHDRVDGSTRRALRQRWGVDDQTRVVALLPCSTGRRAMMHAALAVGIAREVFEDTAPCTRRVVLLIHPTTPGLSSVMDMMEHLKWRGGLIQDAAMARPWHVLPAADAVLAIGDSGHTTDALWAAAAGVPVIAQRGGRVTDVLAKCNAARLIDADAPRQAAAHLMTLIRDRDCARSQTDAAHAAIERRFSVRHVADSIEHLYRETFASAAAG